MRLSFDKDTDKLYFYKCTKYPEDADDYVSYFNHSKGLIGCKSPTHGKRLIFHGTLAEMKDHMESTKSIKRAGSSLVIVA